MGEVVSGMNGREEGTRLTLAVVLVTVNLVPAFLIARSGFTGAVSPFMLSAMAAMIAAMLVSGRFGLLAAAVLGIGHLIAYPVAPYPVLAGLAMGVMALLYGRTARRGLTAALVLAPISIAFTIAEPPVVFKDGDLLANTLAVGVAAIVGGLWGTGVGSLLGRVVPRQPLTGVSNRQAWLFAASVALSTGIAMAFVAAMQLQHGGAWLMLTLFMVIQPSPSKTWSKTLQRVVGTVVGFAIALAISLVVSVGTLTLVLGLVLAVIATTLRLNPKRPYWLYAAILTPAIVLMESSGTNILDTDLARLWFTVVGAGIAFAVVAVLHWLRLDTEQAIENDLPLEPRRSG